MINFSLPDTSIPAPSWNTVKISCLNKRTISIDTTVFKNMNAWNKNQEITHLLIVPIPFHLFHNNNVTQCDISTINLFPFLICSLIVIRYSPHAYKKPFTHSFVQLLFTHLNMYRCTKNLLTD